MKKINLIERLWKTDSHEKQKPQRFARYAAMLIMLLTLGVGQMWAKTVYFYNQDNWSPSNVKCHHWTPNGTSTTWSGDVMTRIGTTNMYYCNIGTHTMCIFSNNGSNQSGDQTAQDGKYYRNGSWYEFNVAGTSPFCSNAWSTNGDLMTNGVKTFTNVAAGTYKFKITTNGGWDMNIGHDFYNSSISSGVTESESDGNVQIVTNATKDITISIVDGKIKVVATNSGPTTYTVTYNGNGNTSGSFPTDASSPYTSGSTVTVQGNTGSLAKTGYHFVGWNTAADYSGTNYAAGATFSISANTTLYAKWVRTIYVYDNLSWNSMKLYTWDSNNSNKTYNGAWSGEALSQIGSTKWYQVDIVSGPDHFILNSNGNPQTENISISGNAPSIIEGHSYETYDDNGTKKLREKKLTVSFNMKSHGSAVSSQNIYYNGLVTEPSPAPSATGYDFGGWYKETGCTNAWNFSTDKVTADTELFAKWTEKTYSLTFTHDGNGTIEVGGNTVARNTTASVNHITTKSLVATANPGYHFTGWTVSGTNASAVTIADPSSTGTSTTIKATAAGATVTAGFAADDVNSLTVSAGTGISSVTGSTSPVTLGSKYSISATVATGYTFNAWTASPAANGTFDAAGSASTNVTVKNGSVTVTASATENMSSLTTSCSYDAGNPGYSNPTVSNSATNVGYVTTRTITAPAAGTGYTFVGWTLTNCTRTDGGVTTANPITIRSNGDGAAATVVANYEEDLSSDWVVRGGAQFGNTWGKNDNVMEKKSGHADEDIVYFTASITATYTESENGDFKFKIYNDNLTNKWWGLDNEHKSYTRSMGTQTLSNANDIELRADVAGPYEIKVDYSDIDNPKITVTFPTSYTLTYDIGTVKGNNGSISTDPETASGSKVLSGNSVTLTGPAAKSGYAWKGWYTNAAGTEGKITDTNRSITVTMNADKTLYACYTEKNYTVTVAAGAGGSVASTSVTGHKDTKVTLPTATPNLGYYFTGWTVTSGTATLTSASSATAAQINGMTAAVTVTANFASQWGLFSSINSWGDPTPLGNYSTSASKDYGYIEVSLAANTQYSFKIRDFKTSSNYKPSSNTEITYANKATARTMNQTSSGDPNQTIITAGAGTYRFTWNITDKSIKVAYPTSYTVTFGKVVDNGQNKGSVSATGDDGAALTSEKYVAKGSATFTAAAAPTGYRFVDWRTSSTYGSGTQLSTSNPYTMTSIAANKTVYANYAENKSTITVSAGTGGTVSTGSGSHSLGVYTTQAIDATPNAGYSWNTWTKSGNAALGSSATTKSNTAKGNGTNGGTGTITATFTPNPYTITLNKHNGQSNGSINVTFDANTNLTGTAVSAPTKTGYTFGGYYTGESGAGTKIINADGTVVASASDASYIYTDASKNWKYPNNITLHAQWTPKTTNITLNQTGAATAGSVTTRTGTYDADMPAISGAGTLPVAPQGYAFMGYYGDEDGEGTQYYNANGTSAHVWDKEDATATLYAYFKKAEIISLVLDNPTIAPNGTVTVTPTVSPNPVGPVSICWTLKHGNGNPVAGITFEDNPSTPGNDVSFNAPSSSGTYTVEAILRTGSACGAGTALHTATTSLVVAGQHDVTIRYQDGSGRTLAASTEMIGRPLAWSEAIEPVAITGYTFTRWEAGDGISITDDNGTTTKTTTTTASIKVKANYDGYLTAVYTKKDIIYFNNTLGWDDVWVYFYNSDKYWSDGYGTGAYKGQYFDNCCRPYWEMERGHMTQIEGTNIWYFDYTAAGYSTRLNVAFTNMGDQSGVNPSGDDWSAPDNDQAYFSNTIANPIQVIRRSDHKSSLPMFVPLTGQTKVKKNNNKAEYMSDGYWMNYPENTGYTLKIYDDPYADKSTGAIHEYPFPFSEDKTMPLKVDVEFNEGGEHLWFMVYRNDGKHYGRNYTLHQGHHPDMQITEVNDKPELMISAPGIYNFTLTYHTDASNNLDYYIKVDYPIAENDYRIDYTDNATWSGSTAHSGSWHHPSDVIRKNTNAEVTQYDTVSFYIAKGAGITASMKFQYVSNIATDIDKHTSTVTWSDVAGGGITLSNFSSVITKAGVYDFIVKQVGTAAPVVEAVEPYTGDYYIRTNCAGNTKWDSYTTLDHQMTYSDYAAAGSDGFTHYYCHWVTEGTNIRFTIANDHSVCVSDTVKDDTYTTESLVANANIRFMYDERTNQIKRAYISGSGTITDRFLVLEGDAKMYDEDGHALTETYQDHDQYGNYLGTDNQVILHDDENFLYERTIQVNATARAKLTAKYNNKIQYFKGGESTTVELLGGTYDVANKYKMRIVYDFKTNRLVTAYMPEGVISGDVAINADMMLIREHQGDADQLTFANAESKLSEVKSVYGVMRFNRWILNNRQHPEDHVKAHSLIADSIAKYHPYLDPGLQKSTAERGLYWVSFPFDVNLSDVFGFGTYGVHWIMMDYDGAARATEGYWKDSEGFWEYIMDRRGVTLEKGKGYVLALDLDLMKDNDRTFWNNEIQQVELFFPSISSTTGEISQTNVDVTVPSHECTIDRRTDKNVADWNKDRRVADSHWNIIGVPSYANYGAVLTDGSSTITWNSNPKTQSLPFLYEWNSGDNTYTVQSGSTYPFKAMHAYYVQYTGTLHWTLASATPASVARRTYEEAPKNAEFRLELQQNDKMIDQTFVKLSNDEEVSAGFAFGEDMNKEFNVGKANIYTFIDNYMPTAGNTLPMTEQTTVVPVGVKIATTGNYTFAIPSGTSGVGVTLVDLESGERTNLALFDYNIHLEAGDYNERFVLEISPIQPISQGIDEANGEGLEANGVRKVLIDNILYIIRDGKVFDARGAIVK